mgnify:CR=1 FL=1
MEDQKQETSIGEEYAETLLKIVLRLATVEKIVNESNLLTPERRAEIFKEVNDKALETIAQLHNQDSKTNK